MLFNIHIFFLGRLLVGSDWHLIFAPEHLHVIPAPICGDVDVVTYLLEHWAVKLDIIFPDDLGRVL